MRLIRLSLSVLLMTLAAQARADLLWAKQANVLCSSASSLAKLALLRDGSRTIQVGTINYGRSVPLADPKAATERADQSVGPVRD